MLREALAQAAAGRKHILGIMEEAMQGDLPEISQYAPRIETITIDPSKIRDIIGSGGKTIRAMQEETGAKINVEDDGTVQVSCSDLGAINEVKRRIELLTAEAKVGATYKGKVVNITNFGAFVEILPGKDGLLHISEIDHRHIRKVEDVLELGDEVEVKCIEIDPSGRVRLSRKALIEAPEGADEDSGSGGGGEDRSGRKGRSRRDRGDREERGGRGGRGDREERGGGRRRRDRDDDDSKPAKSFDDDEDELLLDDDLFEDDDDEAGDDFDLEFEEDGDVEFNAPGNSKSDDQGGGRGRGGRSRSGGGGGRGRGGRPRAGAGAGNGGGGNRRGGGGGRGGNRGGGRGGNRGGNRY
jgi:polyribonucleotide nucleotidyltransferase